MGARWSRSILMSLATLAGLTAVGARRAPHAPEAVLFMTSEVSNCSSQSLAHLAATAGDQRDIWLMQDREEPETRSNHSNVKVGRKAAMPSSSAWATFAGSGSGAGRAAQFIAWLAASPYERAWFVSDHVSLHGAWDALFDADFSSPADIVARISTTNQTAKCRLDMRSTCSSKVSPLQVEWSVLRLSRRVSWIICNRLSNDTFGVIGSPADLVPAICVTSQQRCRVAHLDGTLGRPLLQPIIQSEEHSHTPSPSCAQRQFRVNYSSTLLDPVTLISWTRFDIHVKCAYAQVFVEQGGAQGIPGFVLAAYTEHLRIWNGFMEATCSYFGRFHANCTNKRAPADFVSSFDGLLGSMRDRGFVAARGAAIPVSSIGYPINGAHRIAAAAAMHLAHAPVYSIPDEAWTRYRYSKPGKLATVRYHGKAAQMYHYDFFLSKGLARHVTDWVAHRAIVGSDALHVLHLWPRAVAKGQALQAQVRRIVEKECAADGGVTYWKEVLLTEQGLNVYLRHAYGDVSWLQYDRYWGDGAPLHLYVVRSNRTLMGHCRETIRRLYALPGRLYKASVHVTDFHSEAIVASQMLLNDNSITYLNHPKVDWKVCNDVAAGHAKSLSALGSTPHSVVSTHNRKGHPFFLLPESMVVDTGTALAILGLRPFTDVDLVWTQPLLLGERLTRTCHRKRGNCGHAYGTHNPPTKWWTFHNLSSPADLIHDPRLHGFCSGLKFVSPRQLLTYKRLRFRGRHELKDRRDIELLEAHFFNTSASIRQRRLSESSRGGMRAVPLGSYPKHSNTTVFPMHSTTAINGRRLSEQRVIKQLRSNAALARRKSKRRGTKATRNGHGVRESSIELRRWHAALVAKNMTGKGMQYPWVQVRERWVPPADSSTFDYFFKPDVPSSSSALTWQHQLAQLPVDRPPAGIVYMQIGRWPAWLDFLLISAAANKLVTFYFLGQHPLNSNIQCANCVWLPINESGFERRMSKYLNVKFWLPGNRLKKLRENNKSPLGGGKLNDLKPAVGALFPELAFRHKWFGYLDPDVILGNLSREVELLRDDSDLLVPLERFPEPLANGNFMLMRCVPRILHAFRRSPRWREVFRKPAPMAFDEWHFEGELRHRNGLNVDTRYFSSSYVAWHEMLMTGQLRPQPASQLFVQDAIIQQGVHGMYPLLNSFGASVNLTWRAGQLMITRRGPCVCPDDVIPQPGIASCPECVKNRGKLPRVARVDARGIAIAKANTDTHAVAKVHLDRTLEVLGVHFQMWKKLWRAREYRLLQAMKGLRPPGNAIRRAIPTCNLGIEQEFYLDENGFSCFRRSGYEPWLNVTTTNDADGVL